MIGAAFILTDPIFQGLAISLVFGLASSTALTLLVIPAIYVGCATTTRANARPGVDRSPPPAHTGAVDKPRARPPPPALPARGAISAQSGPSEPA